jgi:hypothetical protein
LKGVQLARLALTLIHTMYVDDVMLFGEAVEDEIGELLKILDGFRISSRLEVNPAKLAI